MDQIIFQVLLRYNPWLLDKTAWGETVSRHLPEEFVPRLLTAPLKGVTNKVSLLVGPRQSGKSTLIWHYMKEQSEPFLLINCEEPSLRELCRSPALFFQGIEEVTRPFPGLFFEEIQHIPDAGLFLKGLVDLKPGVPIFATGSASYHLRSKTRESLAGRAIRHILLPFGMAELWPPEMPPAIAEMKARQTWRDVLLWGGYPEVVLSRNKEDILSQLVEAFVLRDASDLYRIKRPEAFRRLLSLTASQIGNLVNFSGWAENLGISVNTVIEYVNLLEESHLVKLVPPFVGGKRAEITSTPKIFFLDNGLRNFLFGGFTNETQRADYGALVENLVFTELAKQTRPLLDTISFWRSGSGAEVDFVVRKEEHLIAIEVKAASLKRPKVSRSLRSFVRAYQPDKVFVLNESLVDVMELEGRSVVFDKLIHAHTILEDV
jgi:predicted AAA+ superfamily ATPase